MEYFKKTISVCMILFIILSAVVLPNMTAFAASEYTLVTAVDGIGGTVTPSGTVVIAARKSITCNIIPDEGYVIDKITVDGRDIAPTNEYTFKEFLSDHTLNVSFSERNKGDMNGDGLNTSDDLSLLKKSVLFDNEYSEIADMNGNGKVDIVDIVSLKSRPNDLISDKFDSSNWKISDDSGTAVISNSSSTYSFDTTESTVDSAYYNSINASDWTDYQVRAKFLYDNYDYTKKSSYLALVARREASNRSYEFRLSVDASSAAYIKGELYKRSADGYTLLTAFDNDYIQNVIGAKEIGLGRYYDVNLLCKGNTIYCFLNNCLLGGYTDNDNPYLKGTVGMKSYRAKGNVAGFCVTDRTEKTYKKISMCGYAYNDEIEVRSGNSLDINDYKLNITDYDGTVFTALLKNDYVNPIRLSDGKNNISVQLFGMKQNFVFNVKKNAVSSIETRLLANKDKIVTRNNAVVFKNLIRDCDKFSDNELSSLSDDAKAAYDNLSSQLSLLNVPFGNCLLSSKFDSDTADQWGSTFEMKRGKMYLQNSKLKIVQIPYGISTGCSYFNNLYGELSSVSADICIESYDSAAGLVLNADQNGYYYATLTLNKNADEVNARNSATLRVYQKNASGSTRIAMQNNIDVCRGEWFNMQLCISADHIVSAYIDYSLICSSPKVNSANLFNKGCAGVITVSGDATFDNFTVYGNATEKTVSAATPTATYYSTDFENSELFSSPSEWLEESGSDNWAVSSENKTNKYYSVMPSAENYDIYFYDDFNSYGNNPSGVANKNAMIAKGWDTPNNTTGNYNTGSDYAVPAGAAVNITCSNAENSQLWENYSVSADMMYNSDAEGNSYSYISGRVNAKSGYWVRVWAKNGVLRSLELQTFNNNSKTAVLGNYALDTESRIQPNIMFNIKLEFTGSVIKCYLNGECVINTVDSTYSRGCSGIYVSSLSVSAVTYDNFAVTHTDIVPPALTKTYLHVFETNPTLGAKIRYNNYGANNSDFEFVFRNSPNTAYLKVGYDIGLQKWYVCETECETDLPVNTYYQDTNNALNPEIWYDVNLAVSGGCVTLTVAGGDLESEYICNFNEISNKQTGKIGFITHNTLFDADDISVILPDGDTVVSGITEYEPYPNDYAANFEIEELSGTNMIGVGYNAVAVSDNSGETFVDATAQYSELCDGGYPSLLKLHNGDYIRVNSLFEVYSSSDYMASWTKICSQITPYKTGNRVDKIFHVNSLTEVKLSNGEYRIFLPVANRLYANPYITSSSGHYTEVYYSDDLGKTWNCSENNTTDILYGSKDNTTSSWCESKIIACDDGTLRMYYSRNTLGCMQYTVSNDGGITWKGLYQIPEMQCAASSFSIAKDDSASAGETDYYLVWVNDSPISLGSYFSRTRLSLAHSTDGKNWEYLCDIERMGREVYSDNLTVTTPLFQIIDPSITVTSDYIFVSYGCSYGSSIKYHNDQRIRVSRIEKTSLTGREWDASNICNMLFPKSMMLIETPKTVFAPNDKFDYSGGVVKVSSLDGTEYTIDTAALFLANTPDMSTEGTKSITLYNENGFSVTYEINVAKSVT